jgi:hypothetical protein
MLRRLKDATLARVLPPSAYVRRDYRKRTGQKLDLRNPVTFNQKIQWLKLNYHNPILTRMADKYSAKEVVKERLGDDRSVPTAAIFNSPDQIRLADLPNALALKATHGSGWNIISRDKSELDEGEIQSYFRFWLGKSYYMYSKEWAYKHIRPRVICEPLLIDEHGNLPLDYKFFCFGGEARFVQVDFDRFTNHTRAFYDIEWRKQPFSVGYPLSEKTVDRPRKLNQMLELAQALSADLPFLRVDQYVVSDEVFIGELTAYPGNGMETFTDEVSNRRLGDMLELPSLSDALGTLRRQPIARR